MSLYTWHMTVSQNQAHMNCWISCDHDLSIVQKSKLILKKVPCGPEVG